MISYDKLWYNYGEILILINVNFWHQTCQTCQTNEVLLMLPLLVPVLLAVLVHLLTKGSSWESHCHLLCKALRTWVFFLLRGCRCKMDTDVWCSSQQRCDPEKLALIGQHCLQYWGKDQRWWKIDGWDTTWMVQHACHKGFSRRMDCDMGAAKMGRMEELESSYRNRGWGE